MIHGYHLILPMYGFWLPNDPRGSWSDFVWAWELVRFGKATRTLERREIMELTQDELQQREVARNGLKYEPVSIDGQQIRQLTRIGDQNSFAAFSPDGSHIAFLRRKPPNAASGASPCVVIVNVTTGEETVVANDAQESRPVWRMNAAP